MRQNIDFSDNSPELRKRKARSRYIVTLSINSFQVFENMREYIVSNHLTQKQYSVILTAYLCK